MIRKYPRTGHLAGSRLQPGDEDLDAAPFSVVAGRHVAVEEKVDGANCGVSFSADGVLQLQSRGHYLTGGGRERHFALLKQWASTHADAWRAALGARYVCYGEWMYAKHTVFYDALPHYFLEFDVLDRETGDFLDTPRRRTVLAGVPLVSVPVVFEGVLKRMEELHALLGPSAYKTDRYRERLLESAAGLGLDPEEIDRQTDPSRLMEGLYVKVEADGVVTERYKFVRPDFLTRIVDSESHWLSRPIVPNLLSADAELF